MTIPEATSIEQELWEDVLDWEGIYSVSNTGVIKRTKKGTGLGKKGY